MRRLTSRKRKHHYVPQWYLRRWCKHGHLWRYASGQPGGHPAGAADVCFVKYLHSMVGEWHEPDEIEDALNIRFEGPAKIALDSLLSGRACADEKRHFSRFILHMERRHPAWIHAAEVHAREHFIEFSQRLTAQYARFIHTIEPSSDLARGPLVRVANEDVERVASWDWVVFTGMRGELVTSDRPLVVHRVSEFVHAFSLALDPGRLLFVRAKTSPLTRVLPAVIVRRHVIGCLRGAHCIISQAKRETGRWLSHSEIDYATAIGTLCADPAEAVPRLEPIDW